MFTKKVTDDDNFVSLSSSAQALYLHLSMCADDDGFCNQVNASMFKAHASVDDLKSLLEKRYLLQFENGVLVIKHFRMANALRKDRYTPTAFQEELAQLELKDNGSYTWLPNGCQVVATDKNRVDKNRLDKKSRGFTPPSTQEVKDYCVAQGYTIDADNFVDFYASKDWMVGKNKMKDWKAAVRTWQRREPSKLKREDVLPTYDDSSNPELDESRLEELMKRRTQ